MCLQFYQNSTLRFSRIWSHNHANVKFVLLKTFKTDCDENLFFLGVLLFTAKHLAGSSNEICTQTSVKAVVITGEICTLIHI